MTASLISSNRATIPKEGGKLGRAQNDVYPGKLAPVSCLYPPQNWLTK